MEMIPVVMVKETKTRDGSRYWEFWCPFCLTVHVHSAGPGHRHAHCFSVCGMCREDSLLSCKHKSPFRENGYFLAKTLADVRGCVRKWKSQEKECAAANREGRQERWVCA
jgi:hypothetical protein